MSKHDTIKIYLRVKPSPKASKNYQIESSFEGDVIRFHIDKANQGLINNTKEDFSFKFSRVFDISTTQEQIFDGVARQAVESALQGYNSTIFAYGQTGSGKTFTITGGTASFNERGIIPRAIAMIYQELNKQNEFEWSTRISYLQIYNEKGSDLLNRGQDATNLEDLPRVTITEDAEEVVLKGLEMHVSNSVEDALNLLFLGDTNRMYCETPMNQTSSRSHCVFTIAIEAKSPGSPVVRRSKLHLVDLAGSERVSKTGVEDKILAEARYINLSLHYLEQVITALAEKAGGKRDHIPYRNSFMTQVLRDSIGGNCRTIMVATCHSQDAFMDETTSTCRFAQRVASIKQDAKINEETDPKLLIRKLRQEILELKEELSFYKKGDQNEDRALSLDEVERCKGIVKEYLDNAEPEARLTGLQGDMTRIYFCYQIMKDIIKEGGGGGGGELTKTAPMGATNPGDSATIADLQEQIRNLSLNVQQKDNELHLLLNIINKNEGGQGSSVNPKAAVAATSQLTPLQTSMQPSKPIASQSPLVPPVAPVPDQAAPNGTTELGASYNLDSLSDPSLLRDRTAAYEAFRKSYRKYEQIEKSKAELKEKYMTAKKLGAEVNGMSTQISGLKNKVQMIRAERAATGQQEPDAEETEAFRQLNVVKDAFRKKAQELQQQRSVIEHYHLMLEQAQKQLTKDFNMWYECMEKQHKKQDSAKPAASGTKAQLSLPSTQIGLLGSPGPSSGAAVPSGSGLGSSPGAGAGGGRYSISTGNSKGDEELQRLLQARASLRK